VSNSREDPRDWAVAPPQNWAEELDAAWTYSATNTQPVQRRASRFGVV